jgi:hypothetical protein
VSKPIGRIVADAEEGVKQHAAGFNLIGISGDAWILQAAMADAAHKLRKAVST